jgi:tripartite-type tricarboxylate transporter receptor subunit TctC
MALGLQLTAAVAQDFPARPLRMIVASGAGGGTDLAGRNVAKTLSDTLKTAAFVENRPGAGSATGTDFVAKSPPDGHTLLFSSGSSIVMNGFLYKNLPYDSLRDFVAVGFVAAYPFVLVTRNDLPANNLAEFAKFARERPGKLTYASPGVGSVQHVWGSILFRSMGLDLLHVPYKGAASAHPDMIAGRIDAMFDNLSASLKYIEAGRLKALAVSAPKRAPQLPTVPTVNETGVTKFDGESWMGVFAPSATPAPVIDALRGLLLNVVRDAEYVARVERDGGRVMVIPANQQQAFLRQEIERWGRLINQYAVSAE